MAHFSLWRIALVALLVGTALSDDYATLLPCPKEHHHFVVYDVGEDNPSSNEEALRRIREDVNIAKRTFNSSVEEGGTLRLYEGHLATVNEHEERDCLSILLQNNHFSSLSAANYRASVRVSGQDLNNNRAYTFDCGGCPEQGIELPDHRPIIEEDNDESRMAFWSTTTIFPGMSVFLESAPAQEINVGYRSHNRVYMTTRQDEERLLSPFLVEYRIIDACEGSPCENDGECSNNPDGTFACICSSGWGGETCSEDVDDCLTSPCENGDCLDLGTNEFNCTCHSGWSGDVCNTDIDDCEMNPCENGNCTDVGTNLFECACDEGWQGETCNDDVNDCLSVPCNFGECLDLGTNDFNCTCNVGWTGEFCDTDVNDCDTNPCINGNCTDIGANIFECACDEGWQGKTCNEDVDDCLSSPCANGECVDLGTDIFSCTCHTGWTGDVCNTAITPTPTPGPTSFPSAAPTKLVSRAVVPTAPVDSEDQGGSLPLIGYIGGPLLICGTIATFMRKRRNDRKELEVVAESRENDSFEPEVDYAYDGGGGSIMLSSMPQEQYQPEYVDGASSETSYSATPPGMYEQVNDDGCGERVSLSPKPALANPEIAFQSADTATETKRSFHDVLQHEETLPSKNREVAYQMEDTVTETKRNLYDDLERPVYHHSASDPWNGTHTFTFDTNYNDDAAALPIEPPLEQPTEVMLQQMARPHCERANEAWLQHDYNAVIAECSSAIHCNPDLFGMYELRGNANRHLGRTLEAYVDYKAAFLMNPSLVSEDKYIATERELCEEFQAILGLQHDATDVQIKKAFFKLALKYHPDKTANLPEEVQREYSEIFKKATTARDFLLGKFEGLDTNDDLGARG